MKNKEFDKNIRKNYQDYYSEVDVGKTWAAIEPTVDLINKKDRRRRFLFWFLLPGSLIVGILLLSVFYFNPNNLSIKKQVSDAESLESRALKNEYALQQFPKETIEASEKLTTNKSIAKKFPESSLLEETLNFRPASIVQNSILPGLKTIEINNQKTTHTHNNINTKSIIKPNSVHNASDSSGISKNQFYKKEISQDIPEKIAEKKQTKLQAEFSTKSLDSNLQKNTNQNIPHHSPTQRKETIKTTKQGETLLMQQKEKSKKTSFMLIQKLKTLPPYHFVLIPDSLAQREKDSIPFKTKNLSADSKHKETFFSKKNINFTLSLQSGISIPFKKSTTQQVAAVPLLNLRQATESPKEATHFGILFNAQHHSGFQLTSGLQYTRITEKFHYTQQTSTIDTIANGTYALYVDYHGNYRPIQDTVINKKHLTRIVHHYNYYQLIDFPILLGYQFKKGRWAMSVQAGVAINLKLMASGKMLDKQKYFIDIEAPQSSISISQLAPSIHFGFSGKFQLSKKWAVSFAPSFRYFSSTFKQENYTLKQRYHLIGLQLGVGYIL